MRATKVLAGSGVLVLMSVLGGGGRFPVEPIPTPRADLDPSFPSAPVDPQPLPRESGPAPASEPPLAVDAVEDAGSDHVPAMVVDVSDVGAIGDGRTDDTAAIQRANDLVAEAGGGEVRFPPGTYVAAGIVQDSFVTFRGSRDAVIKHPDGISVHIIRSRVRWTRGSVAAGSSRLEVADASLFVRESVVAIRGAGGGSPWQRGRLAAPLTSGGGAAVLHSARGFADGSGLSPNFLVIGDEIISYDRVMGDTLVGVQRGRFGTQASYHPIGTEAAQAMVHYARVRETRPGEVILDRPARFGVVDSAVFVGSVEMKIEGLTLDGNRRPGGSDRANPMPVRYELAYASVVRDCVIRNGDHGGVSFDKGTMGSLIANNIISHSGTPHARLGADIWLFRGASGNRVSGNVLGEGSVNGIYIDDRTVQSTEYDGDVRKNVLEGNEIRLESDGSNVGIAVMGSSKNLIEGNRISGSRFGVRVYTGGQGVIPPPTSRNRVVGNRIEGHGYGIWVDGADNAFMGNNLDGNEVAVADLGRGNRFH